MAREFAREFYSSKVWQDCRNTYAKQAAHLCEECLRKGIYTPGVIVHHVEELNPHNINNPEVALNFNNLELLCRDCHANIHGNHNRFEKVNAERKAKRDNDRRFVVDSDGKVSAKETD